MSLSLNILRAQKVARITFPIEGSIIQQNEGNSNIQFVGQLGYGLENYTNYPALRSLRLRRCVCRSVNDLTKFARLTKCSTFSQCVMRS